MTAAEFKAYFLVEYDAATSLAAPGWEDSEISAFLNIAQDNLVLELYKIGDLQKLAEIINTASDVLCVAHPYIDNGVTFSITSATTSRVNYLYYINSRTKLTRTNPTVTAEYIPNKLISEAVSGRFILTSFNKVWFRYPKIYVENTASTERFTILYDAYTTTPTRAEITYLKRPTRIDITNSTTTELNESLHKMIIELAVQEAVKSIKVTKISNQ